MSGGSLDYIFYKVEEIAPKIPDRELSEMTKDFAELLHDLEWYDSGDTGYDDWNRARDKFKNKWFGNRNKNLKDIIQKATDELKTELLEMIGDKETIEKLKETR